MLEIAHLLDDFAMGGVTRALSLFDNSKLSKIAASKVVPVHRAARMGPSVEADVIIDHMALSWERIGFLLSLKLRNRAASIVHVEHSYTRSFEAQNVHSKLRFRMMLRIGAAIVDKFVCVSKAQRDWLQNDVGIPASKLKVIHPWSGRLELRSVADLCARNGRPLRLLAYGRYTAVKNFDSLISAMRTFRPDEVTLTMFGDGPDRPKLEELASDMPHVAIYGPTNEPSEYLEECDAVIVPSHSEAFGLVATEARLAGRAIIVADVDGLPEQAGSGIVAKMKRPSDIVSAIQRARRAPLDVMGNAGRMDVSNQHKDILSSWRALFIDLAKR